MEILQSTIVQQYGNYNNKHITETKSDSNFENELKITSIKESQPLDAIELKDDPYGLIEWRGMSDEEKNEYAENLKKQYMETEYKGKDIQAGIKASTEIIKRNLASRFDDPEVQKSILDGMAGMSFLDAANFQQEVSQNLDNYRLGKPYSSIYELQTDENGILRAMLETSKDIVDSRTFSRDDYKNFLLDMIKEHESNRELVGSKQVDRYIDSYKSVLNSFGNENSNVISYNRYTVIV